MASFGRETVEAALRRLKKSLSIQTDNDLAEYLNVTSSGLSAWKRRGSIDIALIIERVNNISIDWLLYGVGEPTLINKVVDDITKKIYEDDGTTLKGLGKLNALVKENSDNYNDDKNKFRRKKTVVPILYSSLDKSDTYEVHDEIKGMFEPFIYFNEYTVVVYMNNSIKGKIEVDEGDYMVVSTNRERMNNNIVLVSIEERFEFMKFIKDKSGEYLESLDGKSKNPFKYDGLFEIEGVVIAIFKKMI